MTVSSAVQLRMKKSKKFKIGPHVPKNTENSKQQRDLINGRNGKMSKRRGRKVRERRKEALPNFVGAHALAPPVFRLYQPADCLIRKGNGGQKVGFVRVSALSRGYM